MRHRVLARPRVTLITTVRDGEAHLAACLDSILAQTFEAWELRLVDDGSTDRSLEIARAYADRDARIQVVAQPRLGRRAALATAHADADTELVAWVDADDRLLPEALAKTVAILDEVPTCGLVYTEHRRIDAEGQPIASRPRPAYGPLRMLVDFVTFHFRLFRNATLLAAGGIHPTRELAIDYDLCLRVAEIASVVHLAEPLYEYRVHRGQLSVTHTAEQRRAAADSVRDAMQRRGFAARFELAVGQRRFRLRRRPRPPLRRRDHVRFAVATFVQRARARPSAVVRDVAIWPAPPRDPLTRGISAGLAELGIGPVTLGRDLARLLRSVWSGAGPDLLVLHRLARVLDAPGAGERTAHLRMLGATLERARAQGTAIVWCAWNDVHARAFDPTTIADVLRHCDAVVVDDARALGRPPERVSIVESIPGDALELVPWVSEAHGRAFFGLGGADEVVMWIGAIEDDAVLAATIARVLAGRPTAQFLVCGRPARTDVARALGARVIEERNVHFHLREHGGRDLACALAAADVVIVPHAHDWPAITAALARRRRVETPDGAPVLVGDRPPTWREVARTIMSAIGRAAPWDRPASDRAARVDR